MHELGIVFYIIRDVKEVAEANDVRRVESVTLELGEVSAVIPHYLEDCWNWAVKREPIMDGAKLKVETIPAVTWCDDCKNEYPTVEHGKICPYCGSEHTWLKTGNEVSIKEIEAE